MVCVCTITGILKSQCPILYFMYTLVPYFDVRYTLLHPILYFMYTSVPTLNNMVCEQKKNVRSLAF